MRIDIKPLEKRQGLIAKRILHGIELTVEFSEEEKAIIKERQLEKVVLMERGVPADKNPEKLAKRGLVKSVAIAATAGADALGFDLTYRKLLRGPDSYYFDTPVEAKDYVDELKATVLPLTKAYLEENREAASADSFEL